MLRIIWKYSREMAEEFTTKQFSKEHKKVRLNHALSALAAYIANKADIKSARRNLIPKYGKL